MEASWPSSAFMVVKNSMDAHELPTTKWRRRAIDTTGKDWAPVECARRKAYGCGNHGQKLLEGLTLYVRRLVDVECPDLTFGHIDHRDLTSTHIGHLDLTSALSIGLSSEAVESIYAELRATAGELVVKGFVRFANQHLLIILVHFRLLYCAKQLTYYLVYVSVDGSLYMIPGLPRHLEATYTLTPVPVETADGHALAIMANKWGLFDQDCLCLCTPGTNSSSDGSNMWKIMAQRFPKLPEPFAADDMFSLGGTVFWVDLSQGIIYCNLRDQVSEVDLHFIKLPHGYDIKYFSKEYVQTGPEPEPRKMTRTIGCFGGSIKFVCIDRLGAHPGGEIVNVWTLDLTTQLWKTDKGFPCRWEQFWEHVGFMNVKLWDVEPQYPTLMRDGALCLLLPWRKMGRHPHNTCYICSFDMHSKRPLWFGLVRDYRYSSPLILPCNFFTKCYDRPRGSCQT